MVAMKGKLKIHTENILPIIKKWLYSDKDIFVRELVSNACDACTKLHKITDESNFRIDIKIDKEKRTLTFSDNGIGMTADEVEKYIAQIAFSGAEEFIKKYQTNKEEDQVIGHFGLGFYSSYMVAETVEVDTKSYTDAPAALWKSDGAATYELEESGKKERGTKITLNLMQEEEEYLEEARIRAILTRYCSFLPYPIYLNDKAINETEPLWMKPASECTEKEYLDFYRHLFPMEPDPLFWVHLNVDYPFHLKGILYFPKINAENDLRKETIQLYCNRVFVSDNCKDLLPDYLMILRGAIDSPDIPLNVSRSYLQVDRTVKQLGAHISKKISDRLSALYRSEKEKFLVCWPDIELIIKFGAIQDEKFYERIKEFLVWKNNKEEWTTVDEYLERNDRETIYYSPEQKSHVLDLFKDQEVIFAQSTPIDQAMLHFLERQTKAKFKRIDAHLDDAILDPSKEKSILDADGRPESAKIADFFRKHVEAEVEAKSLASESLPAFLMIKEEERRLRDSLAFQRQKGLAGLVKPTLVVNTNSKLINAIFKLSATDPELADEMAHNVLDLAKLSQREMEPEALSAFITRNTEILEKLAEKIKE
ncbi:MAG: molecular chaperone HtpG [Chlamydiales bacterium]|nr:molecular chaperone HtpG [Chlamydiales bacterium]